MINKMDASFRFEKALRAIDRLEAEKIFMESCSDTLPSIAAELLISSALERIGDDWVKGKAALSQVYMSGKICEDLINSMIPPTETVLKQSPRMAIAVLDDFHLLGKRIVYSTLRANQFDLIDYGRRSAEELIGRVKEDRIEILLISALMLPSALKVAQVSKDLKQAKVKVKIFVGGAPFNFDDTLWKEVNADGMGINAGEAIRLVSNIKGGKV